ncbi:MAG: cytochrome c biogenesis protein ResB [Candidatus Omnitrophota bacterium]|nr:cytochrome c biogenesis protein ResB [Candidatus Omnitrophota bacterium]
MRKIINLLASVKFAVTLLVLIILFGVSGTIIPQGLDSSHYSRIYGPAGDILFKLKLTDVYRSPWLIGLLSLLWLSLLVCAKGRLKSWKKQTGSLLTHLGLLIILLGALINTLLGESGFVSLPKGDDQAIFLTGNSGYRFKKLGFRASLDELSISQEGNACLSGRQGLALNIAKAISRPDPSPPPLVKGRISYPQEQNKNLTCPIGQKQPLAPEGRINFFDSTNRIIAVKTIKINQPFSFKGYTFYLENYELRYLNWVELKVTNDPGIPLVYAGFIFLNLGAIAIVITKNKNKPL